MKYDHVAMRQAERDAFALLTSPFQVSKTWDETAGAWKESRKKNAYYARPENVTMPVELVQEQAFVNTQNQFAFDFSLNAPQPSPVLNNVPLGKNNIAAIYGLRILQGEGANANNRIYRSRGITTNDDSLYNSNISIKMEQSTLIEKVPGQKFRDVFTSPLEFDGNAGLVLINPIRILTGELGFFSGFVTLINSISGLVLSANIFISFRLLICYGQASAVK